LRRPRNAIKIDEFGRAFDCDLGARVDNFFIQLNNNLKASGYVIAYNDVRVLPANVDRVRTIERIKMAMNFRGFDQSRVTLVNGGFRDGESTEFFLVPAGGIPPEPTGTVERPKAAQGTFLWNRMGFWTSDVSDPLSEFVLASVTAKMEEESRLADLEESLETGSENSDEDEAEIVDQEPADETPEEEQLTPEQIEEERFEWTDDRFGSEIARREESTGVLIFYADDLHYDIARLKQFIEKGRDRIASIAKIESTRIEVVFGGYSDDPNVEYHIVPKNGKAPEPDPAERPVEDLAEQME
jgi:hypothetical protein